MIDQPGVDQKGRRAAGRLSLTRENRSRSVLRDDATVGLPLRQAVISSVDRVERDTCRRRSKSLRRLKGNIPRAAPACSAADPRAENKQEAMRPLHATKARRVDSGNANEPRFVRSRTFESKLGTLPEAELELATLARYTEGIFSHASYAFLLEKTGAGGATQASTILKGSRILDSPAVPNHSRASRVSSRWRSRVCSQAYFWRCCHLLENVKARNHVPNRGRDSPKRFTRFRCLGPSASSRKKDAEIDATFHSVFETMRVGIPPRHIDRAKRTFITPGRHCR